MKEISINDTIGIREFMQKYLHVQYTLEGHITHEKMMKFLVEKGIELPIRVSMDIITKEDIINGTYLLVRAEKKSFDTVNYKNKKAKVIPYLNPLKIKENYYIDQLRTKIEENYYNCQSLEEINRRKNRNRFLNEFGYIEDEFGEIMTIEEYERQTTDYQLTEKVNRINKVYEKNKVI